MSWYVSRRIFSNFPSQVRSIVVCTWSIARSVANCLHWFCFKAVEATDDTFWEQFWSESSANISDVFTLIPGSEIRSLRDENPSNLATLCYKVSEKYCTYAKRFVNVQNSYKLLKASKILYCMILNLSLWLINFLLSQTAIEQ